MSTTAERLKEALRIRNMKQAELITLTGINKGALSSYLAGRYEPKQKNLHALARALNVTEAWLMGYDVPIAENASVPPAAAPSLSPDKEELLADYDLLNQEGQRKVREYASDLVDSGRYEKDTESGSITA